MKRTRRKFGAEFKTKVAIEALKERSTLAELAEKCLNPLNSWTKFAITYDIVLHHIYTKHKRLSGNTLKALIYLVEHTGLTPYSC